MTPDQISELLDLYIDDELPATLRESMESYLAQDSAARAEAASMREVIARLKAAPAERPDSWFIEKTLDSLLHENAALGSPLKALRK